MVDWQRLLIAVVVLGVLMLLLRWAYSGDRRGSLVERKAKAGHSNEYGLLVAIAAPGNYIDGELARARLEEAGIRATLVTTVDGPRLMVFREDETVARRLLASS